MEPVLNPGSLMKTYLLTGLVAGLFFSASAQTPTAIRTAARAATTHPVLQDAPPESVGMSNDRLRRMDAVINDYLILPPLKKGDS